MNDVMVVVVTHNSADIVRNCIQPLAAISRPGKIGIVVVDNASTDGTIEALRPYKNNIKVLKAQNNGFGASCNLGSKTINDSKYILFLNPDVVIDQEAICKMCRHMNTNKEIAVVGCKLVNNDGSLQVSCDRFPNLLYMLFRAARINILWPNNPINKKNHYSDWDRSSSRLVDAVSGACMLVRRNAFEAVNGFDEDFFLYWEEADLCYRLKKTGWSTYYLSDINAVHLLGHSTKKADGNEIIKQGSRSLFLYSNKRWGALAWLVAFPIFIWSSWAYVKNAYKI